MKELQQLKEIIETRKEFHEKRFDAENIDPVLMGQIHEDGLILAEIEKLIAKHDKIKSDN